MLGDPAKACAALRTMEQLRPTEDRWREVRDALGSKWEGVQSAACQVLVAWGGAEATEELRAFLIRCEDRKYGWAIRGVVVAALARCIRADDTAWVLDHYFAASGVLSKHELLPLVLVLAPDRARVRLLAESTAADRDNRQAAMKAFANMPFPLADRFAMLRRLALDPDREIRQGAMQILKGLSEE